MSYVEYHNIVTQAEPTTLPSRYVHDDIYKETGPIPSLQKDTPEDTHQEGSLYVRFEGIAAQPEPNLQLRDVFLRIFQLVNFVYETIPKEFTDPWLLFAVKKYVDPGATHPAALEIDRLSEELEEFARQSDIDLDSMLESASVHFTSPVIIPRSESITEDDINALIEDDELHLNDQVPDMD